MSEYGPHESSPASVIEFQVALEALDRIRRVDAENDIHLPPIDDLAFIIGFITGWNEHHRTYPEDTIREINNFLAAQDD